MNLKITEHICPYCHETFSMNSKSFANHVRWCKKNPRYEEIKESTYQKNSKKRIERFDFIVFCENCNKQYTVNCTKKEFESKKYRKTCSNKCSHELTIKKAKNDKYKKISESLKKRFFETHENYNIENHGYEKVCPLCKKIFFSIKKNKICCSKKCANDLRHIKYVESKDIKYIYKKQCKFNFALNEYPEFFNFSLIKEHGWYKAVNHGNNLNGVSRDHIISINEGYKQKIDPYFISHPCNCEIITQHDNAKKHTNSNLTFEKLKEKILKFEKVYGKYENKISYLGIENFKKC